MIFYRPSALVVKLVVSGLFFIVYVSVSLSLLMSPRIRGAGIHQNDDYFQADSEFLAKRVAKDRHTYDRARYHPLFVLFFNPIGRSFNLITSNPEVSASIVNAIAGTVGIFLALVLFHDIARFPLARAMLYTIILGLTSTHFIFSVVPDTFIFTSVGFTALLILCFASRKIVYWVVVSVYTVGATISNVVPVFIAAYLFIFRRDSQKNISLKPASQYLLGVAALFAFLSLVQKLVYNVWLFTDWNRVQSEDIDRYLFIPDSIVESWQQLSLLLKHVFLFSIVPPRVKATTHFLNPDITMATFMETAWWDFPAAAQLAALFWVGLLGLAVYFLFRQRLYFHRIVQLCLLALLFNISLHFLYGDDFMLFACGWLIFLLFFVFFVLEQSPLVRQYARWYQTGLVVFSVSLGAATAWLTYDMYHVLLSQ